jgi:hypothetical protein
LSSEKRCVKHRGQVKIKKSEFKISMQVQL